MILQRAQIPLFSESAQGGALPGIGGPRTGQKYKDILMAFLMQGAFYPATLLGAQLPVTPDGLQVEGEGGGEGEALACAAQGGAVPCPPFGGLTGPWSEPCGNGAGFVAGTAQGAVDSAGDLANVAEGFTLAHSPTDMAGMTEVMAGSAGGLAGTDTAHSPQGSLGLEGLPEGPDVKTGAAGRTAEGTGTVFETAADTPAGIAENGGAAAETTGAAFKSVSFAQNGGTGTDGVHTAPEGTGIAEKTATIAREIQGAGGMAQGMAGNESAMADKAGAAAETAQSADNGTGVAQGAGEAQGTPESAARGLAENAGVMDSAAESAGGTAQGMAGNEGVMTNNASAAKEIAQGAREAQSTPEGAAQGLADKAGAAAEITQGADNGTGAAQGTPRNAVEATGNKGSLGRVRKAAMAAKGAFESLRTPGGAQEKVNTAAQMPVLAAREFSLKHLILDAAKGAFAANLERMQDALMLATATPGREISVALSPESLGNVQVKVSLAAWGVRAQIAVENERAKAEIRRQVPSLMAALRERGVDIDRLDIRLLDNGDSNPGQGGRRENHNPRESHGSFKAVFSAQEISDPKAAPTVAAAPAGIELSA